MRGSDRCSSHLGRAGRKTALTPEVGDRLVAMLRSGNYLEVAARAAGVHRNTLSEWMRRGRAGEEPYAELAARVTRALAEGEAHNVAQIAKAARESWQAAAWLLERQYPDRWGRVSVRLRDEEPPPAAAAPTSDDPFAEVDELAAARRRRET
jgi:hypothetical protein